VSIFDHFAKQLVQAQNGRIHWCSNGWVFGADGSTNRQGVYIRPCEDVQGRKVSLKLHQKTVINCPQPPPVEFPQMNSGYNVPYGVCRKCPNYIPSRRRANYSCCAVLRETGPKWVADTLMGVLSQASQKMKELTR
jgi:hypothetical protein